MLTNQPDPEMTNRRKNDAEQIPRNNAIFARPEAKNCSHPAPYK